MRSIPGFLRCLRLSVLLIVTLIHLSQAQANAPQYDHLAPNVLADRRPVPGLLELETVRSTVLSATQTLSSTLYLPILQRPLPDVVIAAAHVDSALTGEPDEALLLWNLDGFAHGLAGWQVWANGRMATFPMTT